MISPSAIYTGTVFHRRLKPAPHQLRHAAYWLLIDVDALPALSARLRWFSHNRFNLFSFYDRDHADGTASVLRPYVERHLAASQIDLDGGAIRLLCMPRVLGYVFNPLSVYFCYHRHGGLRAILYEVSNTFGQRHSYLIEAGQLKDGVLDQKCRKQFHVSPFLDMALTYDFRIKPPGQDVAVGMRVSDPEGIVLLASLAATRRPLSDSGLLHSFAQYPLLTLKVIAAIHWHALRLLFKGIALRDHPSAPAASITVTKSTLDESLADGT